MYAVHRNSKKKLQRRDHEIINGKKTIKDLQCKVSRSESQIVTLKAKIDRIRHRATYWRSKCSEERQYTNENVDEVLRSKETFLRLKQNSLLSQIIYFLPF